MFVCFEIGGPHVTQADLELLILLFPIPKGGIRAFAPTPDAKGPLADCS